ncbi:phosphatase PAP2 family protein [Bradyrhizobium sp.]|uniref:phosphatase PAP2 family protein n=1 Tax=Bradyrhizobium sp. TaxID=376 RepID=UPI0026035D70|nr:phosphatase PAP2 family protein [Bradyrhizobium sp.]
MTAPALTMAGLWLMGRGWGERPAFALLALAQIGFLVMFAALLSYIAAGAALPLRDASFVALDRLLGLGWPEHFHFAVARPELLRYAVIFYGMIVVPSFGVPLVLGLTGRYVRLQQFVMAAMLTLCVVIPASALVPALGTYFEFGLPADTEVFRANGYVDQLRDLPMLRDGTLRALDLSKIGGIVTFPSFHAATGILAIWGFWCIWWLRPAALIVNGGMIAATPLVGGHYFVDVLAGGVVAAFAILASKRLSARASGGSRASWQVAQPVQARDLALIP